MPEGTAPTGKKKIGPLTPIGWAGVAGGTLATLVIYRRWQASQAASAANAANSSLAGSIIPAGTAQPSGSGSIAGLTFPSFGLWEQAAIAAMTGPNYSDSAALNDLQSWVNGQCVSATGYSSIGATIASLGIPPGFGTGLPSLTVCASPTPAPAPSPAPAPAPSPAPAPAPSPAPAPTPSGPPGPPPNLPAALIQAMQGNGESIVSSAWDPVYSDWLFLTNKGGIYNISQTGTQASQGFFGSIFSLPAGGGGKNADWFSNTGNQLRTAQSVTVNPDGGYTVTDTAGEQYTFGPSQNYA